MTRRYDFQSRLCFIQILFSGLFKVVFMREGCWIQSLECMNAKSCQKILFIYLRVIFLYSEVPTRIIKYAIVKYLRVGC